MRATHAVRTHTHAVGVSHSHDSSSVSRGTLIKASSVQQMNEGKICVMETLFHERLFGAH